tara:strand:- start:2342 stop:2506 length:165 start_codon:yes stop_codon:yes gene_type:complete
MKSKIIEFFALNFDQLLQIPLKFIGFPAPLLHSDKEGWIKNGNDLMKIGCQAPG